MTTENKTPDSSVAGVRYTVIAIVVVVVAILLGFMHKLSKPRILNEHELRSYGVYLLDTPRKFSDAKLMDHLGQSFDSARFEGKWTMIFFGFTSCPDICPTTLAVLSKMYRELSEEEAKDLQVLLVSLDPERDTAEKLAEYVPYFRADFVGATTDSHRLLKLATELNVAFARVPLGGGEGAEANYTIDHSGNVILVNPYGHFYGYLRPPFEHGNIRVAWRSLRETFSH